MSINTMKLALEALENASPAAWASRVDSDTMKSIWRKHAEALEGLQVLLAELDNTSCKSVQKRLEAQQPATGEPVLFIHPDTFAMNNSHVGAWKPGHELPGYIPLYTHPAPSAPKDDQIAALVNKVRDIARMFHDHQSLREHIAIELVPALKVSQEVKSNAERWRHAISDGGNQSMNFLDIFDDWDGDGDFVEAFDAAMLAANDGGK